MVGQNSIMYDVKKALTPKFATDRVYDVIVTLADVTREGRVPLACG
jgi:hypothetical protein